MGIAGSLEDTTIEEIKFQMETNLFGVLRVCHGVIPVMRFQITFVVVIIQRGVT
jgi:NAD(P)-dependent dehydrogenase (short-subunit alcohol dehydrogenase family)